MPGHRVQVLGAESHGSKFLMAVFCLANSLAFSANGSIELGSKTSSFEPERKEGGLIFTGRLPQSFAVGLTFLRIELGQSCPCAGGLRGAGRGLPRRS